MSIPNIDIKEELQATSFKRYPLNSRLISSVGIFMYILDTKGYRWIPEHKWKRHARKYLRSAKYVVVMADGTIIEP